MFGHRMVPDEFGHFPEYREVTGTPRGFNGPYWALVEERRGRPGGGHPPSPVRIGQGVGGAAPSPFLSPSPLGGILLGLGVLVGLPSPPLYTGAGVP